MNRVKRVIHATRQELRGYTGAGVTAAVLDTGIALHPDLSGRLAGFRDFCQGRRLPYDDSGHGTHVTGCLCGNGSCSNGMYAGIAPGCRVLSCKVLDRNGEGDAGSMIEAIRYVLETRRLYHTRILNISVGVGKIADKRLEEELFSWLLKAWDTGIFVAVAAGNGGPAPDSISPMGLQGHLVSVGCHDGRRFPKGKGCQDYSGRGPKSGQVKKPDVVAPGTHIISCSAWFVKNRFGAVKNAYTAKSGTSMAVPAVSGTAALLWEKYPHLTNEQVRERILQGAEDLGEAWGMQGWGMLHASRALM
ncbi:MAG: S8 family serine peptidase [Eisenbergiella sp.]